MFSVMYMLLLLEQCLLMKGLWGIKFFQMLGPTAILPVQYDFKYPWVKYLFQICSWMGGMSPGLALGRQSYDLGL